MHSSIFCLGIHTRVLNILTTRNLSMRYFITFIALLLFVSCQKQDLPAPDSVSAGRGKKGVLVVSEERMYQDDFGVNYVTNNYYENGRLVKFIGPEGPEAGIVQFEYDDVQRTVTKTWTSLGNIYQMIRYFFNDANQIIKIESFSKGTLTTSVEYVYEGKFPVRSLAKTYRTASAYREVNQHYQFKAGKMSAIKSIVKEFNDNKIVSSTEKEFIEKGHSPFEYAFYDQNGQLMYYELYSNIYKSPGYNIRIYPGVDLRDLHLPKRSVMEANGMPIILLDYFSQGMLRLGTVYVNDDGTIERHLITNIKANKEHLPVSYDRSFLCCGGEIRYMHFAYKYIELK